MNEEFNIDEANLKESIELKKNSKGIYQWSIKLREEQLSAETISRLDAINNQLERRFNKDDNRQD